MISNAQIPVSLTADPKSEKQQAQLNVVPQSLDLGQTPANQQACVEYCSWQSWGITAQMAGCNGCFERQLADLEYDQRGRSRLEPSTDDHGFD
jgi:hypothetical protein